MRKKPKTKFYRFLLSVALMIAGVALLYRFGVLPGDADFTGNGERLSVRLEREWWRATGEPLPGTPDLGRLKQRLAAKGLGLGAPVFIRIFKRESKLELWLGRNGKFHLFDSYPICRWSGQVGPKLKQGDRQAPEGFYTVSRRQLNPGSRWYRAFNLGYPNRHDRANGRTGDYLMVHGGCSSRGCYAMTNPVIGEIWKFVTAAFRNGQKRFYVHAYPFRMTAENLERNRDDKWSAFWQDLKKGYDLFEATRRPPRVSVCGRRYRVAAAGNLGTTKIRLTSNCR